MKTIIYAVRWDFPMSASMEAGDIDEMPLITPMEERHVALRADAAREAAQARAERIRRHVKFARNVRVVKITEEVVG